MKKLYLLLVMILMLGGVTFLTGCSVGTQGLFIHPSENGYGYGVVYDALGGTINTMKQRTAYYKEDSLLFEPQGSNGMLIKPQYGTKTLLGWYSKVEKIQTEEGESYKFNEEDRWDFAVDRVSASNTVDNNMTLYARWIDTPKLLFMDSEDPNGKPLLEWTINPDSEIKKPTTTEPKKKGYTLLDYYMDPDCTERANWTDGSISIEHLLEGSAEQPVLYIYCKFLEGDFYRIRTVSALKEIKADLAGTYILADNMNLSGAAWEPVALTKDEAFTGTFIGNGYTISNFKMEVKNIKSGIMAAGATEQSFAFFGVLDGAAISDLNFADVTININSKTNVPFCAGVLAGRAFNSKVENCGVDRITITADGKLKTDVVLSAVLTPDGSSKITGSTIGSVDLQSISTSGTLDSDMTR